MRSSSAFPDTCYQIGLWHGDTFSLSSLRKKWNFTSAREFTNGG